MKGKTKAIIITMAILVPLLFVYFFSAFSFTSGDALAYEEYTINGEVLSYLTENSKPITISKQEARKKIEGLFEDPFYIYTEGKLEGKAGFVIPIVRTVRINESLSASDYAIALTHELTHLTNNTNDERTVEFDTFLLLFESSDFKSIACALAINHLYGLVPEESNCASQIQEYLIVNVI